MKKMTVTAVMLLMLGITLALFTPAPTYAGNGVGHQWLATGIVTRTAPDVIFLLGKDDVIYRIDARRARVLLNDKPGQLDNIQVGDRVRVYGKKTGAKEVAASQMNVIGTVPRVEETLPPPPQVTEPIPQPYAPPAGGTAPVPEQPSQVAPTVPYEAGRGPAVEPSFTGRGLVKDLHLTEGWITILTSDGPVVIDLDNARVYTKGKVTSTADISLGDAIYVAGDHVATGQVAATRVDILSKKSDAEAAKPIIPVSEVGRIVSLDYSARTFTMDTGSAPSVFVMVDDKTDLISVGGTSMAFTALKPGTRVKVSGLGSYGTGFLAQSVIVIGAPR